MIKLSLTDKPKVYLLIENGIRFHTTEFTRPTNSAPSMFTQRLRKFLRTRRIESIYQAEMDRLVIITIGSGENTFHLILELYAAGNIILTDSNYKIILITRSYVLNDNPINTGSIYPVELLKPVLDEEDFTSDDITKYIYSKKELYFFN